MSFRAISWLTGHSVRYAKRLSYVLVDSSKEVDVLRLENFSAQKSVNGHDASSHMPIFVQPYDGKHYGRGTHKNLGHLRCEYVLRALVGLCNLSFAAGSGGASKTLFGRGDELNPGILG